MRLNPVLAATGTYPFVRLTEAKRRAQAQRAEPLIDFGLGEPREETPRFIREALVPEPVSTYPLAEGLPELRTAAAGWVGRRFGATVDPATELVPTLGAKEAVFSLAQVVDGAVGVTTPGYPVAERGARFAGREVVPLPLRAEHGWLPDLDAIPFARLGLLWVNSPNNPTAAVAPLDWLAELHARCRAHDVVLAADEAYAELWFDPAPPPPSALQLPDRTGVLAFHTLSKRSSMPGYRSGFVAGDPELVGALKRFRPNTGTAPPTFVQRASVVAWDDDAHVAEIRARYGRKRAVLLPALRAAGLEPAGGDASFFLWLRVATGETDEALAARLLAEHGIVVAPGAYLGPAGEGHVRVALVPTIEQCERAAAILRDQ